MTTLCEYSQKRAFKLLAPCQKNIPITRGQEGGYGNIFETMVCGQWYSRLFAYSITVNLDFVTRRFEEASGHGMAFIYRLLATTQLHFMCLVFLINLIKYGLK